MHRSVFLEVFFKFSVLLIFSPFKDLFCKKRSYWSPESFITCYFLVDLGYSSRNCFCRSQKLFIKTPLSLKSFRCVSFLSFKNLLFNLDLFIIVWWLYLIMTMPHSCPERWLISTNILNFSNHGNQRHTFCKLWYLIVLGSGFWKLTSNSVIVSKWKSR